MSTPVSPVVSDRELVQAVIAGKMTPEDRGAFAPGQ